MALASAPQLQHIFPPNLAVSPTEGRHLLPRLLKSCAKSSSFSSGVQLHALAVKLNLSSDLFVQTSLLSLYSSCGRPDLALHLFDQMPHRNVVVWTAAVDGLNRSDRPRSAVSLFVEMQESDVAPDALALVSLVSACSALGALSFGRGAHGYLLKLGAEPTPFVCSALVDMYVKCGCVDDALKVFRFAPNGSKTVHVWNAMLYGFSLHGLGMEAVRFFEEMERVVTPNDVTFVALLCGCAHTGLVREGKAYFDAMPTKYGIEHTIKHFGCMVDLLGRAGLLNEAYEMVEKMPVFANHVIWGSLLNACRMHNNVRMAEIAIGEMVAEKLPEGNTSPYLIMSNMYRDAGLSDKAAELRTKVGRKPKGRSWLEMGGDVHEFSVGIGGHPMRGEIKAMLHEIAKIEEDNASDDELESSHSEKVAVAFGLIRTKAPAPIRISKNLRICQSCHEMMKLVSHAYKREIIVRDCNRFHRFTQGLCSCNDYW